MTKEEAKQIIATWLVSSKGAKGQRGYIEGWFDEEDAEAFRMAIEALQTDTTQGVGRYENAMQKLREMPRYLNNVKAKQIKKISIDAIQGEWIKHEGKWVDFDFYPTKYECNQCHYCVDEGYDSIFCPNCGARMKGGVE